MNSSDACRPQVNYNNALPGTIWCMLTILCAILKRLFLDWNCYAVAGDGRCHYGNHSPERRDVIGDSTFSRRLQDRPKRKFWYQSRRARNFGAKQAGFPKTFSQSSEESCYWRCCRLTNNKIHAYSFSILSVSCYWPIAALIENYQIKCWSKFFDHGRDFELRFTKNRRQFHCMCNWNTDGLSKLRVRFSFQLIKNNKVYVQVAYYFKR